MNAQMKRYNRLKADGLCVDCGGELDRQGVRCVSCLLKKEKEDKKTEHSAFQSMSVRHVEKRKLLERRNFARNAGQKQQSMQQNTGRHIRKNAMI